jgi:tetratricopeptide (TPR) repeat protein
MRHISISAVVIVAALAAGPALASFSGGKHDPPETPQSQDMSQESKTPRQEAERKYGDAYDEVTKGKKDLADGKQKNAEKHFKKALDRGMDAVALDSTYYEAWNLVGFSARNLKLYDQSLDAYGHCLRIKPDFAAAREYLGEAYVELGQIDKAREQLQWLQKLSAVEEQRTLTAALDTWTAAHPDAKSAAPASTPPSATPAPETADTLKTGSSSGSQR